MHKPTVFIGSSTSALATAELVKVELSSVAQPIVWNDRSFFRLGTGTFEALVEALDNFDFAVLLFTPDDPVIHNNQSVFKPRDNVLIEFGLFTGGLGRKRTFAMRPFHESLHIPTDLAGVTVAKLSAPKHPEKQRYDVTAGCEKIAAAIRTKWFRKPLERELGVLYRLVNAFTFPHYADVHVPALKHAQEKYDLHYRLRETFDTVDEVVSFLGELLSDYVYPQLSLGQLQSMRIYFAYYLGDGVANLPDGADPRSCLDRDSADNLFQGEFVIGLANPAGMASEQDWRVGKAIKGFSGIFPESRCAQVFKSGRPRGFSDAEKLAEGEPNYWTPNELSMFAFPVTWQSEEGAARIGILAISSRSANSIRVELRTIMEFLANVVGFLFSLYAVRDRKALEQEGRQDGSTNPETARQLRGFSGIRNTKEGRRFAAAACGLRRLIAGHFEGDLIARTKHRLENGKISSVSASAASLEHAKN